MSLEERIKISHSNIDYGSIPTIVDADDKKEGSTSNFGAYCHIVCMLCGSGILQLSYSINQGGLVIILLIMLSSYLVYFSGSIMNELLYITPNRMASYMDIGQHAFKKPGKYLVQLCQFTGLLIQASLYYVLCSINLKIIFPTLNIETNHLILLFSIISCLPFVLIKSLKEAQVISMFGVLTTIIMVIVIVYSSGSTILNFENNYFDHLKIIDLKKIPISAASVSFAFGGNVLFPHVEKGMNTPVDFNKVLKYSMLTVGGLYCIVGSLGYFAFLELTKSPIFQNINAGILVSIAIIALNLHLIATVPICLTTLALDVEPMLNIDLENTYKNNSARKIFRLFIFLLSLTIALIVPYFSIAAALCGAFSNGLIVYLLPAVFYLKLKGFKTLNMKYKISTILLIFIGLIVVFIGTYDSIKDLVNAINNDKK